MIKKLLIVMIFIGILISGCAKQIVEAQYDPEIPGALNENKQLPILVRLKDDSGIEINGSKEERRNLQMQRDKWFEQNINDVLLTLPEKEFNLTSKRSDGFSGWITKKGFERLVKDSRVNSISWIKYDAHTTQAS